MVHRYQVIEKLVPEYEQGEMEAVIGCLKKRVEEDGMGKGKGD